MGSWVMAVEVTPSELVAVDVGRDESGPPRPRSVTWEPSAGGRADGVDAVDALADALTRLAGVDDDAPGPVIRPGRLVVATPPDTERRRFEEIAEATALAGLPAPAWLPGPVAHVGDRLAAELEPGAPAVVLDARADGLTAWPVRRSATGADIGARGPVATATRLDQLLLGVVRAQLRSLDPESVPAGEGPRPGARGGAHGRRDDRGDAARLRREVRRARARLAAEDTDEVGVPTAGPTVRVDRGVFDQLVDHALRETLAELADARGEGEPRTYVLAERPTPLARRLAHLVAGSDDPLVLPSTTHDGVHGMAALLLPSRPRPARAASGAQAIRAARGAGSPPARVGAGTRVEPGGPSAPDDADLGPPTPEQGLPAGDPVIPAARVPSTPVQAQRDGGTAKSADDGAVAFGAGAAGHAVLAGAAPHGARPSTPAEDDEPRIAREGTPRGGIPQIELPDDAALGSGPFSAVGSRGNGAYEAGPPPGSTEWGRMDPEEGPSGRGASTGPAPSPGPAGAALARRPEDTSPEPAAAPGGPPRGAVAALAALVVVAVIAAVTVLLVGPAQVGDAFQGLGGGVVLLASLFGA